MWYVASLLLFVACVKLLTRGESPTSVAGIFAAGKVVAALVLGGGISGILLTGAIASLIGFGYFRLLRRVEHSGLWWLVLAGGAVLLI